MTKSLRRPQPATHPAVALNQHPQLRNSSRTDLPASTISSRAEPRASTSSEPRPLSGSSSDRRPALAHRTAGRSRSSSAEARRSRSTLAAWAVVYSRLFAAAFFAERCSSRRPPRVWKSSAATLRRHQCLVAKPTRLCHASNTCCKTGRRDPLATAKAALVVPEDSGFQI